MRSRTSRAIAVVVAVLALCGLAPGPARADAPGGYNEAGCVPAPEHPNPVVLLHGLGAPPGGNFPVIGPQLAAAGFCAYALDYGAAPPFHFPGGFAPIEDSAAEIRAFITELRTTTGAAEVDIVGHSEGGFNALYVPKRFGLGAEVGRVVALAPPTHGTDASGFFAWGRALGLPPLIRPLTDLFGCRACDDLAISEAAVHRLNDGPIAVPGIEYTVIASRYDVIVTPIETTFVDEPGVTNLVVQDVCPSDPVGHGGLAFDSGVVHMIRNALDPAHATPVACSYGFPF